MKYIGCLKDTIGVLIKRDILFLFMSDDFLNTLHWTQKEIETEFDNKLVNMLHPEDRSRLEKE